MRGCAYCAMCIQHSTNFILPLQQRMRAHCFLATKLTGVCCVCDVGVCGQDPGPSHFNFIIKIICHLSECNYIFDNFCKFFERKFHSFNLEHKRREKWTFSQEENAIQQCYIHTHIHRIQFDKFTAPSGTHCRTPNGSDAWCISNECGWKMEIIH